MRASSIARWFCLLVAVLGAMVSLEATAGMKEDFDRLELSLRLKPAQKLQFDIAVSASQRALLMSAISAQEFQQRLAAELMKRRPDLATLFAAQEDLIEQNRPLFRAARDEWLRLYATLDDEQVRIARDFVEKRLASAEQLAGVLRGLLGSGLGPDN